MRIEKRAVSAETVRGKSVQRGRKDRSWLLAVVGGLLFFVLVLLCFPWKFAVNDDQAIVNILDGALTGTPQSHAVYLLYPLSWILKYLYTWNQELDWYRLVMVGICSFAASAPVRRLVQKKTYIAAAAWYGAVFLLWTKDLTKFTYSTCGAFVAAMLVAAYALQNCREDRKPGNLADILLLYVLTYSIRKECCYMALPFLGLFWLIKYGGRIWREKSAWLIPVLAVLCFAAVFGLNQAAYGTKEWKDYWTYNNERTYLQDYKNFPDYEENQAFFEELGLTREEYDGVKSYRYLLLDEYSEETLHQIYLLAKEEAALPLSEKVRETLARLPEYLFRSEEDRELDALYLASLLLPALLFLYAIGQAIQNRGAGPLIRAGALLLTLVAMWLYIAWGGRFPDRVEKSLRILTVSVSFSGLLWLRNHGKNHLRRTDGNAGRTGNDGGTAWLRIRRIFCRTGLLLVILAGGWKAGTVLELPQLPLCQEKSELVLYVEAHPDQVFIKDTGSSISGTAANLFSSGGWSVYSPLYQEKLQNLHLEEISRSLLLQPDVYLLVKEGRSLQEVLNLPETAEVEAETVQEFQVGGKTVTIWQIQKIDSGAAGEQIDSE